MAGSHEGSNARMNGRPLGITIIAIVLAVGGLSQILVGTEVLGYTNFGLTKFAETAQASGWASIIGGVLSLIVAGGLFTTAGWAWLLAVVVLGVRVIVDIFAIVTHGPGSTLGAAAIANLVISGIALWYFMRPNVKAAFGR
jgi:hypothetical protein